uniref:Putative secreted protein n=1 Tax=Ixodes scapularis TaxID=6945 RepID=A0A4D5RYA5_IXOSC
MLSFCCAGSGLFCLRKSNATCRPCLLFYSDNLSSGIFLPLSVNGEELFCFVMLFSFNDVSYRNVFSAKLVLRAVETRLHMLNPSCYLVHTPFV